MGRPQTTILVALLSVVAAVAVRHAHARIHDAQQSGPALTREVRAAGFRFSPSVAPADRQLILHEIALARPEARRLVGIVDGLVTISVGDTSADAPDSIGLTQGKADGFEVTLNLGALWGTEGERGEQRLILHELGHVVDAALVKPDLAARLDAQIPAGYGCEQGTSAPIGCAPRAERFAETFAKWATGDIGINLPIGYKVAPPPSLDDWGAQLVSGIGAA